MFARALSKYVRVSPYKLRPIVNVIRGWTLDKAFAWLKTCSVKRAKPIEKVLLSAYHNAKHNDLSAKNKSIADIAIKEIKVDGGPVVKYYKPTAMGRASVQRKRTSHIEVILQ